MAVLLKNLLARTPKMEDLVDIAELIAACDTAEYGIAGMADSTMEDLVSNWQQPGFDLTTDAWVIVTNKGQIAGFACVWHRDYEQISTYVCVHPEYRGRGIGTLLLRLVEERARQYVRNARPGVRVTLCGTVSSVNEQAKRLFEHEGYTPVRRFWRIAARPDESIDRSTRQGNLSVDLDVDSQDLAGASQLYDLDAVYIIREYYLFEKELRAGAQEFVCLDDEEKVLMAVG